LFETVDIFVDIYLFYKKVWTGKEIIFHHIFEFKFLKCIWISINFWMFCF